jgi:DNA-binding response OmpR family regulator
MLVLITMPTNDITPSATEKLRVYLVEDTTDLCEEFVFGLTALGLDVSGYGDAGALYRALASVRCDIVVIDVGLPGEDGFSIARHLRADPSLGIVFLTSRAMLSDRLHGLELGADAYLVKPIDLRELAAILQAIGRRLRPAKNSQVLAEAAAEEPTLPVSGWTLLNGGWALRNPHGNELSITEAERCLLKIMLATSDQVVERDTLIAAFEVGNDNYDPHRLDAVISRLRKRTEQAGLGKLPLQSIRGTGYVFTA